MMLKGFWGVYPGRFWPGPLKLVGYPLTLLFLLLVTSFFIVWQALLVAILSPKLVWWLFQRRPPASGAPA